MVLLQRSNKDARTQRSEGSPPEQDSPCLRVGFLFSSFVPYLNFLQEVLFLT